jgi:hypothetical protein
LDFEMNASLKIIKRVFSIWKSAASPNRNWHLAPLKQYGNDLISRAILSGDPFMMSRLGATELAVMVNRNNIKAANNKSYALRVADYISGRAGQWWPNVSLAKQLQDWSGFYPVDEINIEKFCVLLEECLTDIDVLGSWLIDESQYRSNLENAKTVILEDLEPFFCDRPWTHALAGKRVLVIHPFATSIEVQFAQREKVFPCGLLPSFSLETMQSVQTLGEPDSRFPTWFDALDYMIEQVQTKEFDVCIIGCGAYGMPLARHVKSMGKVALHLGGVTQLLFGIRGARWEEYAVYPYKNYFNKYWVRPRSSETPKSASKVENGCYW